jgi:formate-dependent phosphoribosylglycinamide formyltransferase (GAR transformylase)
MTPITQQKLKGLEYQGAFYPAQISRRAQEKVIEYSNLIADKLGSDYFGLCGLDYIVQGDDVFLAELNPRKTGTTIPVSKMLNYSLSVLEYKSIFDEYMPHDIVVNEFPWEV